MKMKFKLLALVACIIGSVISSYAAEKITAGPKGGRLLATETGQAEFFVTPEHKVEITFYDAALKPTPPGSQAVAITVEKDKPTQLELQKTTHGFISTTALPTGAPYRVVVQMRAQPNARPKNFRIDLDLATCGECKLAEYACICGH